MECYLQPLIILTPKWSILAFLMLIIAYYLSIVMNSVVVSVVEDIFAIIFIIIIKTKNF